MNLWAQQLAEHRGHPSFRVQQWPLTLEWGFTCECSGEEQEFRIRISAIKAMLPEARESLQRLYRHHMTIGTKHSRREMRRANGKAKALLHRFLSPLQRLELRKTKGFTLTGQDGRTYLVTEGSAGNVRILEGTEPTHMLCVVADYKTRLPIYDLMLAQKVLLENDIQFFLRTARVRDLKTQGYFQSGAFLLGESMPPPPPPPQCREPEPLLEIDRHDIDEPEAWVRARLQGDVDGYTDQHQHQRQRTTTG